MGPYQAIGQRIAETVERKQEAYGDSFGKSGAIMRVLYPDGIPPGKLDDALTVVRVVDKLFRIATDRDALGESPWDDVAGYALLAVRRREIACGVERAPDRLRYVEASQQAPVLATDRPQHWPEPINRTLPSELAYKQR